MAEFKKLSDVEMVAEPVESANVLIEEDGVIKKAPKSAVGGAGGDVSIKRLAIQVTLENNNIRISDILHSDLHRTFLISNDDNGDIYYTLSSAAMADIDFKIRHITNDGTKHDYYLGNIESFHYACIADDASNVDIVAPVLVFTYLNEKTLYRCMASYEKTWETNEDGDEYVVYLGTVSTPVVVHAFN